MATFHSIRAPNGDHLCAIGRVAVEWTSIEKAIELLVWELAPLKQPNAQAVTTHISLTLMVDMVKALAHERLKGSDLEERLKKQLAYIFSNLRPKRNSIVHGLWGPTGTVDRIVLLETTARGLVKFKVGDEMTSEDILNIASEIDQAHFELMRLTIEISTYLGQVTTIHLGGD